MYFSGFSLKDETELFYNYLINNDFTVSGFSYGAIQAFEYVCNSQKRIDRLQLFSPAFFHDKDEKYKRMQMMFFQKNSKEYANKFLMNCGFDMAKSEKYFDLGSASQLQELLYYEWDTIKLQSLIDKGVTIEVYLGEKDKIIDAHKACEFFKEYAEVYFIKNVGHILQ